MRVLVLGAGAVGGYFGGRLAEAGRDVTFLLRPARAAAIAAQGLVIDSPAGNVTLEIKTVTDGAAAAGSDLVLLACKAYDLDAAMQAIAAPVRQGAVILPLLNGLAHIERLQAAFGEAQVIGGMCQVLATLGAGGEIRHLDKMARLVYGRFAPQIATQQHAGLLDQIDALFAGVNFASKRIEPVEQSLWDKWIMLATMAGVTSLMRSSIGAIMAVPGGADLISSFLAETSAIAAAAGQPPSEGYLDGVRKIVLAAGSAAKASLLRDMERGGRIEGAHIIGDLVRRAEGFGLATPLLRLANLNLQVYEQSLAG
jgi:2-dehydropantoate 2-reductase